TAFEEFEGFHLRARIGLETLAACDLGREAFERAFERDHLAEIAAGVGALRPQLAVGILCCAVGGMRADGSHIDKTQFVLQAVAITKGFAEQFAGVEEDHRLRTERGYDGGLACEFAFQREFENALGIAAFGCGLQRGELCGDDGIAGRGGCEIERARHDALGTVDDGDGGAHDSHPFFATRSRVFCETWFGDRPSSRQPERAALRSSRRAVHSPLKRSSSHSRRMRDRPGALPPVETVTTRSPRRTAAGTWKSQRSGTSSTLTRTPAWRASWARRAERSRSRPATNRTESGVRALSAASGATVSRVTPACSSIARRRAKPSPAPASPTASFAGSRTIGSMKSFCPGRDCRV